MIFFPKSPTAYTCLDDALESPHLKPLFESLVPPVVIFPVSHAVAFSVIRAFEKTSIPILGLDFKPRSAGLYSRQVTPLLLTGLYDNENIFAENMLTLGAKFKTKPVLFMVDDEDLFLSLKRETEFSNYYHLPLSGWGIVSEIVNKRHFYQNLQESGFPCPKTWFTNTPKELDAQREKISYPCIVKPAYSTRFRKVFGVKAKRFDDFSSLRAFVAKVHHEDIEYLIQEFIPGDVSKLYTFASFSDDKGCVLGSMTGRKVHQFPADFGTCRLGETVYLPELADMGRMLISLLGYQGIALAEFKRTESGEYKVIEINPRPGDWPERLAQLGGANLVVMAYQHCLNDPIDSFEVTSSGIKWIHFAEDFYYCVRGYRLLGFPDAHCGFWKWLYNLRGIRSDAFFSWRDPLPAWIRLIDMIRDFRERERNL